MQARILNLVVLIVGLALMSSTITSAAHAPSPTLPHLLTINGR